MGTKISSRWSTSSSSSGGNNALRSARIDCLTQAEELGKDLCEMQQEEHSCKDRPPQHCRHPLARIRAGWLLR